ncbi:ubiquitin-40S ribosomal protein S27a [Savitreella phatthalungensis]
MLAEEHFACLPSVLRCRDPVSDVPLGTHAGTLAGTRGKLLHKRQTVTQKVFIDLEDTILNREKSIMQLFVRGDNTFTVDVPASASVRDLQVAVASKAGFAVEEQRLVFAGQQLEEASSLAEYGVTSASTINLVFRLCGGAKKRKKKVYTTPKKIKHKRKKVKMAVIKYYKVEGDGKIQRLRRECPAPSCGAGVFMANHKDRQYCGKCGLTYMVQKS